MPRRPAPTGRKLLRAATDELGLTTPDTARRRTPVRRTRKAAPSAAKRRVR